MRKPIELTKELPLLMAGARKRAAKLKKDVVLSGLFILAEGLLLPNAVVLGGISPFGIAFLSCFFMQHTKLPILLFTALGYGLAGTRLNPLPYWMTLCVFYLFTLFYQKAGKRRDDLWLIPFATTLSLFGVQLLFVAMNGFLLTDLLKLGIESILCFVFSVLFMGAIPALKGFVYERVLRRSSLTAIFLLLSVTLLPLARWHVGFLSLGRMLGLLLVMSVMLTGGIPLATMCGTVFGLCLGLADDSFLLLCTGYGVGALAGSALAAQNKGFAVTAFGLVNGLLCIYGAPAGQSAAWVAETAVACLVMMLLPITPQSGSKVQRRFPTDLPLHESKVKELTTGRLHDLARGFREVYETVQFVSDRMKRCNFADSTTAFQDMAAHACKSCSQNPICWNSGYNATIDSLAKLLPQLRKNGAVTEQEFAAGFARPCLRTAIVSRELTKCYNRYLLHRRISEEQALSRGLECQQFIGLSGTIEQMALEIDRQYRFDTRAEEHLSAYLAARGIPCTGVLVLFDESGKVRIELELHAASDLTLDTETLLLAASDLTQRPVEEMDVTRRDGHIRIILREREHLHPVYATLSAGKAGENGNGDRACVFRTDSGKLVMVLADGMGSGKRAELDAVMAVRVVEKVMLGGFETGAAMNILNGALALTGGGERITAVDVAVLDLCNGSCEFIKAGAAPTYIKKSDGTVYRLENGCIPVGVLDAVTPDRHTLNLWEHDFILMVSDGVCGEDDTYLTDLLKLRSFHTAKSMAEAVMTACQKQWDGCRRDDCTVLAVMI